MDENKYESIDKIQETVAEDKVVEQKITDYTNIEPTPIKDFSQHATQTSETVVNDDGVIEGNFMDVSQASTSEPYKTAQAPYYSETIKDNNNAKAKDSGFKRFIAGVLVASLIGGPMIGVGSQLAKPLVQNFIQPLFEKTAEIEKESFAFNETAKPDATPLSTNITTTSISPAVAISKAVGPSVVGITSTVTTTDFFNRAYSQQGSGSGIIFNSTQDKVYIVTNNHVIEGATKVVVTLLGDQKVEAKLVGTDEQTDLAVITVEKSSLTKESVNNVVVAKFGDSSTVAVGELAIAIGNPLGEQFSNSVTQGVISGVDRQIQVEDRNLTMLQTDAAINPGNSGGALVNSKGEIIGINTIKYTDSSVEGMGFAIPTNIAKPIIEELVNKGYISRPYLGIVGGNITQEYSEIYALPIGVYVKEVTQGSGAQSAGIKVGDVIIEFGGDKITSMEQLSQLIKQHSVGDKVSVRVIRNGKTAKDLSVVLQDSQSQVSQTQPQQSQDNQQYYYSFPFGR